jgi:hypothetical protein
LFITSPENLPKSAGAILLGRSAKAIAGLAADGVVIVCCRLSDTQARRASFAVALFDVSWPERPEHISPGHRPGFVIDDRPQALKGRNNVHCRALSGLETRLLLLPGALPQADMSVLLRSGRNSTTPQRPLWIYMILPFA